MVHLSILLHTMDLLGTVPGGGAGGGAGAAGPSHSALPGRVRRGAVAPQVPGVVVRRAVGYVRVSTSEQAQHGLGLPVQQQAIIDYCRREGYDLVQTFCDPGVSGTLPWYDRPEMAAALAEVAGRAGDPVPVAALVVARGIGWRVRRLRQSSRSASLRDTACRSSALTA